ncbi:MAG: pseudouridine synthase [Verrucomicrobiota bacterium]|nr:pseudouridine synthase [Verrucomicrobiota bacterium]
MDASPQKIINIAAYKFTPITELRVLRERLLAFGKSQKLKGSLLLAPEGVNLFMAGTPEGVDAFVDELRSIPGLEELKLKYSETDYQPFNRLLIRIKKEIIAFGVEGINPSLRTSPKLSAQTLKQWLDDGKPITLLDTRNDYEIKLGTFENAIPIGIDHFRDFPQAVEKLPHTLKERPVVMFCTGGIRCEKAGPFMEKMGFKNIFQLDGGILKYFEDCGGDHYNGECFVFDQRVGVDPSLHETGSDQCFNCLTPLTKEEQQDQRYVAGKSCPYCYQTQDDLRAQQIAQRHAQITKLSDPLPGSIPYDNFRPIKIQREFASQSLIHALGLIVPNIPATEWESLFSAQLILNSQRIPVLPNHRVKEGEIYLRKMPSITEPDVRLDISILYEDEALTVINKPAPLPIHASGRYNRNTLQYVVNQVYAPQKPHPAHRLDANTTGLVLLTRTRHFASLLQPQFEHGLVKKVYLAKVNGSPESDSFLCNAPIGAEPKEVGTRDVDFNNGLPSETHFTVIQRNPDGSTLLEARPITGRTNQIRVHLWHLDLPIVGDPVYVPSGQLGTRQTLDVTDPPLHLHAWKISFIHPLSRQPMTFEAPCPWANVKA